MFLVYVKTGLVLIFVICDPGSGHQRAKTAKEVIDQRNSLAPTNYDDELTTGDHRTGEQSGLEGTFKGHVVQPPAMSRDIFN